MTGGSTVILPKGTTTYSTGDWGDNGAPTGAYPTSAVTKQIGEYCCVTFTNAYENNQANGLQVKASGGVISLDIVSNYGVDVEVVCSGQEVEYRRVCGFSAVKYRRNVRYLLLGLALFLGLCSVRIFCPD